MSEHTRIAWTDHTFNPWWGCVRVSPGCEHCYAETFSHRLGMDLWGPKADRRFFGDKHWNEPLKWARAAAVANHRARVFCASMADVFEDRRDLDPQRERLWTLIEATPMLDWQLLTKRPENMNRLAPERWRHRWPDNVWAMATAEDTAHYFKRVRHLERVPARIRGISYEPAIGPLDFEDGPQDDESTMGRWLDLTAIQWVIVGGESGPGARRFDIVWARKVIEQCRMAGVAVFVKQMGANPDNSAQEDGALVAAHTTGKGDDPDEWADDLRVREFPA